MHLSSLIVSGQMSRAEALHNPKVPGIDLYMHRFKFIAGAKLLRVNYEKTTLIQYQFPIPK